MAKRPEKVAEVARQIADDLRLQWMLRRRGDSRGLRPDEVKIMERSERDIDAMIARRIRSLFR